jgi:hypothetical protein
LYCLAKFHVASLSKPCLLLFLLPAILGAGYGVRTLRIRLDFAMVLAVVVTALMIPTWSKGFWIFNLALLWPSWYIVATTRYRQAGRG